MIYELAAVEYPRVRALVAGLAYHLSVQAMIDGTVAGRIWVDNVVTPQAAFVLTPEGQYLVGAPANAAFNQALADLLAPRPGANVTYDSDAWGSTFAAVLAYKFGLMPTFDDGGWKAEYEGTPPARSDSLTTESAHAPQPRQLLAPP